RRHTRFSRDWSSDVCSSDLLHFRLEVDDRALRQGGAGSLNFRINGLVLGSPVNVLDYLFSETGDAHMIVGSEEVSHGGGPQGSRSEERRVGKRGGCRWVRAA